MRISLQMVAVELGLNRSTISRALRNDPEIADATKRRVKMECERMGYRPNSLISDLASFRWQSNKARATVIAFIVRAPEGNFVYGELIPSLQECAAQMGYELATFYCEAFSSSARLQRTLRNRGITDVILGPVFGDHPSYRVELDWDKFICIQLLPGFDPLPLHSVVRDHYDSVLLSWNRVVEHGYRRIGITLLEHPFRLLDDIIRRSAVDACQKYLFPDLPALPPLCFSIAEVDELRLAPKFAAWRAEYKPDAVIEFNLANVGQNWPGYDLPFCCLNGANSNMHGNAAGIIESFPTYAKEAVHLLQYCRRSYIWGLPEQRINHVVEPIWQDGDSLPPKK